MSEHDNGGEVSCQCQNHINLKSQHHLLKENSFNQTEVNYLDPLNLGSTQCFFCKAMYKGFPLSKERKMIICNSVFKWSCFVKLCLQVVGEEVDYESLTKDMVDKTFRDL